MASGHPLVSGASGKTNGCTGAPACGWGAGAAGTTAGDFGAPTADDGCNGLITGADGGGGKGDGAGCGLNPDGTGSGEEGLIGGGGNGTVDLIGVADGAWGVAGFRVTAGPDAGRCLGAIAGAGAADVFAGDALMRTALNGSPLGPKMPPTSSGTSTFFCTVRRGNCSGLS